MKAKINIRNFLEDHADHRNNLLIHASVDVNELFDTNSIPEEQEIDFDDLLADHQAIGIVWDIRNVKDQRPDLSDDEVWEVLQAIELDRLNDPILEDIRHVAEKLYPRKRRARPTKAGEIIASYGTGDERENLVDLLADAMHWCEGFGEPFEEFCGSAGIRFAEESPSYKKGA